METFSRVESERARVMSQLWNSTFSKDDFSNSHHENVELLKVTLFRRQFVNLKKQLVLLAMMFEKVTSEELSNPILALSRDVEMNFAWLTVDISILASSRMVSVKLQESRQANLVFARLSLAESKLQLSKSQLSKLELLRLASVKLEKEKFACVAKALCSFAPSKEQPTRKVCEKFAYWNRAPLKMQFVMDA